MFLSEIRTVPFAQFHSLPQDVRDEFRPYISSTTSVEAVLSLIREKRLIVETAGDKRIAYLYNKARNCRLLLDQSSCASFFEWYRRQPHLHAMAEMPKSTPASPESPSIMSHFFKRAPLVSDGLGVTRQAVSAAQVVRPSVSFLSSLSVALTCVYAPLTIVLGLNTARTGVQEVVESHGDPESVASGSFVSTGGAASSLFGAFLLADKLGSVAAGVAIGPAILVAGAAFTAKGVLDTYSAAHFRYRFHKAANKIEFLEQEVYLTEQELNETGKLPPKECAKARKILLEKKRKNLAKNTSLEILAYLLSEEFHKSLKNEGPAKERLELLIAKADRANFQQIVKSVLLTVVSLFDFAASIAAFCLPGGALALPIIFGICALLWVLIDCSPIAPTFANWLYGTLRRETHSLDGSQEYRKLNVFRGDRAALNRGVERDLIGIMSLKINGKRIKSTADPAFSSLPYSVACCCQQGIQACVVEQFAKRGFFTEGKNLEVSVTYNPSEDSYQATVSLKADLRYFEKEREVEKSVKIKTEILFRKHGPKRYKCAEWVVSSVDL